MRGFGFACALTVLCAAGSAAANEPRATGDLPTLQADLDRAAALALTDDCTLACRALDSMRRSAERICELDPKDACARASETLRKARDRVRSACPSCATAKGDESPPGTAAVPPAQPAPPPPPSEAPASPSVASEKAPPKGGGCAGCATHEPSGTAALPWALGLALLIARRRRSRRHGP